MLRGGPIRALTPPPLLHLLHLPLSLLAHLRQRAKREDEEMLLGHQMQPHPVVIILKIKGRMEARHLPMLSWRRHAPR